MTTTHFGLQASAAFSSNDGKVDARQQANRAWKKLVNQLEPDLLQFGDTGADVKTFQLALKALSVYTGVADGYFGPATEDATQKLQETLGTDINGMFDQATWYALSFWAPHCI